MRTLFTAFVKYVLTRCDHLFTFSEGQVKQEKNWVKTDFTHFPDDLVDFEALPRGGFARFSNSVDEVQINRIQD